MNNYMPAMDRVLANLFVLEIKKCVANYVKVDMLVLEV
jgi:hypothetical protein